MKLSPQRIEENWLDLSQLIVRHIPDFRDQQAHLSMLRILESDTIDADLNVTFLGFKRAPAAKGNHHAFEGGLVYHLLEMWSVYEGLCRHALNHKMDPQFVNDERVLKAIIYHDLHKAYRTYKLVSEDPWQCDYAKDPEEDLMTTDIKSLWLLNHLDIKLDPQQLNALCWAEGGFSKIKPWDCSVLAKLCYLLDEMSGNVLARMETRTYLSHRRPEP
jgi:hypothetical protein